MMDYLGRGPGGLPAGLADDGLPYTGDTAPTPFTTRYRRQFATTNLRADTNTTDPDHIGLDYMHQHETIYYAVPYDWGHKRAHVTI